MEPKESLEVRTKMAAMHDDVLSRIKESYKAKRYIDVCWLCYACFESRVNRALEKICSGCTKPLRTANRTIGITRKLECCARLIRYKYPPLASESVDLINTVKGWCKERNQMVHGLVSLDRYGESEKEFASLAKRGMTLVKKMYGFGTNVREYYYQAESIPSFGTAVVERCPLKEKCIK